jgi:hypothetical protein
MIPLESSTAVATADRIDSTSESKNFYPRLWRRRATAGRSAASVHRKAWRRLEESDSLPLG